MVHVSAKASSLLKIGAVLFCFMCLFFATYMASRYEHEKTKTEIQTDKVKALEEKYQELMQSHTVLVQERAHMAQEIEVLRTKTIEFGDWKDAVEKAMPSGAVFPDDQPVSDEKKVSSDGKEEFLMRQSPASASIDQIQTEEDSAGTQTGDAIHYHIVK